MFEPDTDDPFALFDRWYAEAQASGEPEPDAMALATTDGHGRPSVRMVLVKGADRRGFVFYTHLDSRKGEELAASPQAALCFHWKALGRQVRVEGPVESVTDAEADAYFARQAVAGSAASVRWHRASRSRSPAARCCCRRLRSLSARTRAMTFPGPNPGAGFVSCPIGSSSGNRVITGCTTGSGSRAPGPAGRSRACIRDRRRRQSVTGSSLRIRPLRESVSR